MTDENHESEPRRDVDAFTALGEVVRDRAFQREAKGTLHSLGAALAVTFSEAGEHLRERFNKPGG